MSSTVFENHVIVLTDLSCLRRLRDSIIVSLLRAEMVICISVTPALSQDICDDCNAGVNIGDASS